MAPILLIVGPPNGGKGTLCDNIVRDHGFVHLSGGDILRDHIRRGTSLGKEAKSFMDRGELVPDAIMINLFVDQLKSQEVQQQGALLDGFPRTQAQGEALTANGIKIDAMIVLEVPDDVLLERSAGRRLDPTTGNIYHLKFKPPPADIVGRLVIRADDTKERQMKRIDIYKQSLNALLQHFSDVSIMLNANQSMAGVYSDFVAAAQRKGILRDTRSKL